MTTRPKPVGAEVRSVALPEIKALRELRHALAHGGLPPRDKRTPENCARIAAFWTIVGLLRLLEEYKRRVEGGERCSLVERVHASAPGRFLLEIAIEAEP